MSTNANSLKPGDFSGLAENYSKFRPKYSESLLTAVLSLINKEINQIDFADVGAGTGIWTRMVSERGLKSVVAIEPNDDMRDFGIKTSDSTNIKWVNGSGEDTTLEDDCVDLVSMASSFHWVDFEKGTKEFSRILRPNGRFIALWNPRYIEANPLLVEIENKLRDFAPNLKRVSSGRSGLTETLTEKLEDSPYFEDTLYIEARHVVKQTPDEYLGVWWSVNDIRAQAGEENFKRFMDYVNDKVSSLEYIETTYLTRAWTAKKS